jgi:hypothetical protein
MTEAEVLAILGKPWDDDSLLNPERPSDLALQPAYSFMRENQLQVGRMMWLPLIQRAEEPRIPVAVNGYFWTSGGLVMIVISDDKDRVMFAKMVSDPDPPRTWLPARVWRRLRARYGW